VSIQLTIQVTKVWTPQGIKALFDAGRVKNGGEASDVALKWPQTSERKLDYTSIKAKASLRTKRGSPF
jgi:hypothetical protein